MQLEEDTWYYIQGSDTWTSEDKEILVQALIVHGFQYTGFIGESGHILIKVDEDGDLSVTCDSTLDRDFPLDLEV